MAGLRLGATRQAGPGEPTARRPQSLGSRGEGQNPPGARRLLHGARAGLRGGRRPQEHALLVSTGSTLKAVHARPA